MGDVAVVEFRGVGNQSNGGCDCPTVAKATSSQMILVRT